MTENVGMCPVCYDRSDAELRTVPGVIYSKESNCPKCSRAALMAEVERLEKALISAAKTINANHARADKAKAERDHLRDRIADMGYPDPVDTTEHVYNLAVHDVLRVFDSFTRANKPSEVPQPAPTTGKD